MSEETILIQVGTLLASLFALLIAYGRAWVVRLENKNERETASTQIELLRQELEGLRERSDLETRTLVNTMMERCIQENQNLQASIRQSEVERVALQSEFTALKKRIEDLEYIIQEKDQQIDQLMMRFEPK